VEEIQVEMYFYFNGLKVDANGDINVFGIGFIKAEGRTIAEISSEIQDKVNENFQEGKSEVRLNTNGITFYVLGDVETTGVTGEKVVHKNTLTITEALAISGGLNRTVDRKISLFTENYRKELKKRSSILPVKMYEFYITYKTEMKSI
jgi:polysaccharide export outer membrane protein